MSCNYKSEMSSSDSASDKSGNSEFSDYELEVEEEESMTIENQTMPDNEANIEAYAYSEEPIADEEWIIEYERQEKEAEQLEEELTKRLSCTTLTNKW